jgi:hypothetical protein
LLSLLIGVLAFVAYELAAWYALWQEVQARTAMLSPSGELVTVV